MARSADRGDECLGAPVDRWHLAAFLPNLWVRAISVKSALSGSAAATHDERESSTGSCSATVTRPRRPLSLASF
jgi:hypothetical protein